MALRLWSCGVLSHNARRCVRVVAAARTPVTVTVQSLTGVIAVPETMGAANRRTLESLSGSFMSSLRGNGDVIRLAVLAALAATGALLFPGFLGASNLGVVLTAIAGMGILALGMTMVIITGEIDLSVAGIAVLATVIGGTLLPTGSPVLVIGSVLLTGLVLGFLNGFLVAVLRLPSLIVTLAMMGLTSALANIISRGQASYPNDMQAYLWFGRADMLNLPVPVVLFVAAAVAAWLLTRFSVFGQRLHATGGNRRAAELSGVRTWKVRLAVFMISGLAAATVGLIESARLGYINPAAFSGLELRVLAVAVLGGAVLSGGVGTVSGTVLAAPSSGSSTVFSIRPG